MGVGESEQDPRLSFLVHVGVWYHGDTESGASIDFRDGEDEVWRQEVVPDTQ